MNEQLEGEPIFGDYILDKNVGWAYNSERKNDSKLHAQEYTPCRRKTNVRP